MKKKSLDSKKTLSGCQTSLDMFIVKMMNLSRYYSLNLRGSDFQNDLKTK